MERDQKAGSPYQLFALATSAVAILALAVHALVPLDPGTRVILEYFDYTVCALFACDFTWTLWRSKRKVNYMLTWGWLDLLSSIPAVGVLRVGRLSRIVRVLRVLRGLRAARVISTMILSRRGESVLLAATLVSILLVFLSSIAILQFERSDSANIKTPEDAIWWAIVTITTVGYGDRYPVSTEGRILAVMLMTAGVGLFGTFSGFVASWFLSPQTKAGPD